MKTMLCSHYLLTILFAGILSIFTESQSTIISTEKLRVKRSPMELSQSTAVCERFSEPLSNNTFFSPIDTTMLSDNYPPEVDCILIISAPPGFVIKLDFRNKFDVEPSPMCEYDYLEIRDGKYGFSNAKSPFGRYCGRDFPDEIFSSDNYLWLRFHSDDNIEYGGFEGVFEYMERPRKTETMKECNFEIRDEIEGSISEKDINQTFITKIKESQSTLDCLWMIEVKAGWQIMLSVERFDLKKKNDCESNFVDIIGDNTNVSEPKKHFCGVVAEAFESKSNRLHVRYFATGAGLDSQFALLYTAFTKKKPVDGKNTTLACGEEEFDCDDDTCIDITLKCNKRPNCKFKKDEANCNESEGQAKDLWVIIAVFSALLGAMTSVFLFNCIRTLVRDQKIIRETIRQSKESKLDEAGRLSIKRSLENVNRIIPGATGYTIEPTLKKIQDDEVDNIYHGTASLSSLTDSPKKLSQDKYDYRDELKKFMRVLPTDSLNNNASEGVPTYSNEEVACQTRQSLFETDSCNKPYALDSKPFSTRYKNHTPNPDPRYDIEIHEAAKRAYNLAIRSNANYQNQLAKAGIHNLEVSNSQRTPSPASSSNTDNSRMHVRDTSGSGVKMEHSQLMLEIRNSAPDVIIMTSQ